MVPTFVVMAVLPLGVAADNLLIAPAERFEVLVNFTNGQPVELVAASGAGGTFGPGMMMQMGRSRNRDRARGARQLHPAQAAWASRYEGQGGRVGPASTGGAASARSGSLRNKYLCLDRNMAAEAWFLLHFWSLQGYSRSPMEAAVLPSGTISL
jgi:hypothetical protein